MISLPMPDGLIVQKYGGSSLDSPLRIREVAERIAEKARQDHKIIVTVSAMGKTTDSLLALAGEITPNPPRRELDMLLTVGERISMALLSMALNGLGCPAISYTGSQSGIVTSMSHTNAVIEEIRADRIRKALEAGKIVIVAGFQGVNREREITTLGRGGSDTTAVALASVLGARQCEIYSDFPGLFTADPRLVGRARRIPEISYDEMLELASLGAKVLHYRAVDIARYHQVPLHLLSIFGSEAGTIVHGSAPMEKTTAKSITANPSVVSLEVSAEPGASAWELLQEELRNGDFGLILYQKSTLGGKSIARIVIDECDRAKLESILEAIPKEYASLELNEGLATVSVVGWGFAGKASIPSQIEKTLSEAGIPVDSVTSSSLSVTCLIPKEACKRAVEALHEALFRKG